ncbi:Nuclear protein localization protein 4 -like protein [Sarcoptes scabiei]|uniref:Nuclear protein localization protein 4 -like protein n=1 Tax=Sarcoptes scabiei TaxID=52283 RepID=A0A834R2Q1_SARSC|nr:Nuclear protein localization protein 4 -like protein [Sarcoptes scabiei]UXI14721.1 WD repeat domain phosphoinositide-interacting protein 2 [Sarcoptes scabiei]
MIIRVQSPNGSKRIECDHFDTTYDLYLKIQKTYDLEDIFGFKIFQDKAMTQLILMQERKSLDDFNLKHGDLVYLNVSNPENMAEGCDEFEKLRQIFRFGENETDEVDLILAKSDGLVRRKCSNLCHHGPSAQCVHCAPLEPYDENYMKEQKIKYMSFHAYLKKLHRGLDKGKFISLKNESCKIKPGCKSHAAWPKGICTKCQPSAITLNQQTYRHVDNITFENTQIVDNFLNYWRITGNQRIGFLYGYYEQHKDLPLGIRAVVVSIYEPPQESTRDSIKLHFDQLKFDDVDLVASELGYKRIGWIFTDLLPEENGKVKHTRNVNTYFLSSQECIMAGFFQNCHPNLCKLAKSGCFGSKFVTVCITGDNNNQIHIEAYQVSNQCMALVRDDCLLPTFKPELASVRSSNKDRYVPDVFYKRKDEYGNEVIKIARPLPIEYLLIDVPVSAPIEQSYLFNSISTAKGFPIENRLIEGHLQDFNALLQYMKQFSKDQFLEAMMDFHLLIYLLSMETVSLHDSIRELLPILKAKDKQKALKWSQKENWSTVEELIRAHSDDFHTNDHQQSTSQMISTSSSSTNKWSCNYCTFENEARDSTCEMCTLPKS